MAEPRHTLSHPIYHHEQGLDDEYGWEDIEPCDECGSFNCRCDCARCCCSPCACDPYDPDDYGDRWGGDHIGDAMRWAYTHRRGRWRAAWRVVGDDATMSTAKAAGRALSPVGAPLGGYRKQRRANRRRAMQAARKWRRSVMP